MRLMDEEIEPFLKDHLDYLGHDCLPCADVAFQRLINKARVLCYPF